MTAFTREINVGQLAAVYQARMRLFPAAVRRALQILAVLVHRQADRNLSGAGAAWENPVPRRSGRLARGMFSRSDARTATIGNTAPHAWAVHSGLHPRWPSPPARPRQFLFDAANATDHLGVMQNAVRGAW